MNTEPIPTKVAEPRRFYMLRFKPGLRFYSAGSAGSTDVATALVKGALRADTPGELMAKVSRQSWACYLNQNDEIVRVEVIEKPGILTIEPGPDTVQVAAVIRQRDGLFKRAEGQTPTARLSDAWLFHAGDCVYVAATNEGSCLVPVYQTAPRKEYVVTPVE